MNPNDIAKIILLDEPQIAEERLFKMAPKEAIQVIESILNLVEAQEPCLLLPNPGGSPFLKRKFIIRKLFAGNFYESERETLRLLNEEDQETAAFLESCFPQIRDFHGLKFEIRSALLEKLTLDELVVLRSLLVFPDGADMDRNEARNVRVHFARHLSRDKLAAVRKLVIKNNRPSSAVEARLFVPKYRQILYEIEASVDSLGYGFGGHPDPQIGVYSYRVAVTPKQSEFEATVLDLPQVSAVAPTMKMAVKAAGDSLAKEVERLIQQGLALPNSLATTSLIAIAVHNKSVSNYWHPTEEHVFLDES
tara:strand:+ start:70 stop:990 length:921 start_codon:yes stop_codon:yes gene_type:complete